MKNNGTFKSQGIAKRLTKKQTLSESKMTQAYFSQYKKLPLLNEAF